MKSDTVLIGIISVIAFIFLSSYYNNVMEQLEIQKIERMEKVKDLERSCQELESLLKRYKAETRNKFAPILELCEVTTKELENEILGG